MGKLLTEILGNEVVGRVSLDGENGAAKTFDALPPTDADIVIDFSHHDAVEDMLHYALAHRIAAVIGTTGHTPAQTEAIAAAAREIPVFYSGNMSLGIAVLCRLAKEAAAYFPDADIEIVETHHNRKADAPSGTAHMLFRAIREVRPQAAEHCGRTGEGRRTHDEIGVSSLRMGGIVGIHEVHICTGNQCLTLRHEAYSRRMLAEGAVDAAHFTVNRQAGLYDMNSLLERGQL